tara:strand:+ start:2260 stop:3045 length:786 start_codon:yes stop_codon:yes gene_type:complete
MSIKHNEINIANCCIQVEDCCVEYENILALDNVSFSIPKGSFIGVLGPNGGGKSTLFNAIAGLENITHGKIIINGESPQKSLGKISYVPQKEMINWKFPLSVYDVVSQGKIRGGSFRNILGFSDDLVVDSLKKVNMYEKKNEMIANLSGGEKQRTFIARALAQESEILLLDEAFSGVDFGSQEDIADVLKLLTSESKTILMSTHDLNSLSDRYDKVLCLNGHICAYGSPEKVLTEEVLKELYGVHKDRLIDHRIGNHNNDL